VVEDECATLKMVELTLSGLGHKITTAANGQEAWEAFDRNPYRIVISDWSMPEMDGLELCKLIRNRPETPYVYFILLTGVTSTKDNYQVAMESGVDDFLTKPLNTFMLEARLCVAHRIIEYTQTIKELRELLPICSYCKKIRTDDQYWEQFESYIHRTTGADFSHGVCLECYDNIVLPELEKFISGREEG